MGKLAPIAAENAEIKAERLLQQVQRFAAHQVVDATLQGNSRHVAGIAKQVMALATPQVAVERALQRQQQLQIFVAQRVVGAKQGLDFQHAAGIARKVLVHGMLSIADRVWISPIRCICSGSQRCLERTLMFDIALRGGS